MDYIDQSWKGFYKISGVSVLLVVLFFLIGLVLDLCYTMPISPTSERLEILSKQQGIFQLINASYILCDIFLILGGLGIYLSLHKLKKNQALAGAALVILGATLAVGVRFGVFAEAVIANLYVHAATESLQAGYIAAAELIKSSNDSGLLIANLLIGAGDLITGVAMLAGVFNKKVAYLYIVGSLFYIIFFIGITCIPAFFLIFLIIFLIGFLMLSISLVFIGLRLYAIGNNASTNENFDRG